MAGLGSHMPVPCPFCDEPILLPVLSHVARDDRIDIHLGFGPMGDHIEEQHMGDDVDEDGM